ncbi:MAG: hypothetical protein ACRDOS_00105 [Gaiellaceae bacterium]
MSGACFGFRPVSELPFEYLRDGDGEPLEIREHASDEADEGGALVTEWTPVPGRRSWSRLYEDSGRFRLWVEGGGTFHIDPRAPSVALPIGFGSIVRREERLWGVPALLCFLARGDLPLHAASVEVDGEAILLAAPGYAGKTTLAAGFDAAGHRVLSEDVSCIRLSSPPTVVPGPAMLRVRRDLAGRLKLPGAQELAAGDDRVHLSLDRSRRGDCTPLPIRALVFLRRGDGDVAFERVPTADALRDLWALSFRLPTIEDRERCFQSITALADTIRIWNLSRRLRLEGLRQVIERIAVDA